MEDERKAHTLIQSYVLRRWFVSTAYRRSSVCMLDPPWYYETIIWEWDEEARMQGEMLAVKDSGSYPEMAAKNHAGICVNLIQGGK